MAYPIFVRGDERQWVFIVRRGDDFFLVETAEQWELPAIEDADLTYAYYPTVFGNIAYPSLDQAEIAVRRLYPWVGPKTNASAVDTVLIP